MSKILIKNAKIVNKNSIFLGDVLIDGVLHSKGWWFICGQNTLEVKGTVVKTRNN